MSRFKMKLPDVGEGVAEAELVSWLVDVGDEVTPETAVAEVLTDKSTFEVSSPVSGTVVRMHYHTAGGVIEPGRPIAEILPSDAPLIIEAQVARKSRQVIPRF